MDSPVTTQMSTLPDIVVKQNFYDLDFVAALWEQCKQSGDPTPFVDEHGVFKGKHIADQLFFDPQDLPSIIEQAVEQAQAIFPVKTTVVEAVYQALHLPWDIHCDVECDRGSKPYYNLLIPFHDVPSRTIVFNQRADEHDAFWKYKQMHPHLDKPIHQDIWNQYLSMCWPEDRLWLSIKEILPNQSAGQLVAFNRYFFHSSDSFNLWYDQPKYFLQVLLDRA
jgi:hypothetical protein